MDAPGRNEIVAGLVGLGWEPDEPSTLAAAIWAARGQWDKLVEMGEPAIALAHRRAQGSSALARPARGRQSPHEPGAAAGRALRERGPRLSGARDLRLAGRGRVRRRGQEDGHDGLPRRTEPVQRGERRHARAVRLRLSDLARQLGRRALAAGRPSSASRSRATRGSTTARPATPSEPPEASFEALHRGSERQAAGSSAPAPFAVARAAVSTCRRAVWVAAALRWTRAGASPRSRRRSGTARTGCSS